MKSYQRPPIASLSFLTNQATLRLDLSRWPGRRFRISGRFTFSGSSFVVGCSFNDVAAERACSRVISNNSGVVTQALTADFGSVVQQTTADIRLTGKRSAASAYPRAYMRNTCRVDASNFNATVSTANGALLAAGTELTSFSLVALTSIFLSSSRLELFDDGPS